MTAKQAQPAIITVANSARMLAQCVQQAGFPVLAIDRYDDSDTRSFALAAHRVDALTTTCLLPALKQLMSAYNVMGVIYGSGLEQHLDSLRLIEEKVTVLGNSTQVFAQVNDKAIFFSTLDRFNIPHPDVSFYAPESSVGWLSKPMLGQGGVGVKWQSRASAAAASVYYQRYQEGESHSVLFLANGKQSQIFGFNRQWTAPPMGDDAFLFSGILNCSTLTIPTKVKISAWVDQLVAALGLKGLNSLDFIQCGQASYVLEINPRPSASVQLYDADLIVRHISACQGELLDYRPVESDVKAYQIVYAACDTVIPDNFTWPDGVVDIPNAGTRISQGQPICSMMLRGNDSQAVLRQLTILQENIINQLDGFQTHAIYHQCK